MIKWTATALLDTFKKLTRLRRMTFVGCRIRNLDISAFAGLNLTYLNLASNHIGEPPLRVTNETCPKRSPLRATEVISDKIGFGKQFSLYENNNTSHNKVNSAERSLFFSHSSQHLPHHVFELAQIFSSTSDSAQGLVDISKNAISDLEKYPLLYFNFAINLDLSHNRINYIGSNTFQHFRALQGLKLAFNLIEKIHPCALLHLVNLAQ